MKRLILSIGLSLALLGCPDQGQSPPAKPAAAAKAPAADVAAGKVFAERDYRDDRRESSTMHRMSLPYSDSIIESLAAYYAGQPAQ